MVYDSDFREAAAAAVDTAYNLTAKGADTPGAFIVPTTASRITGLKFYVSGIVTDVVMGAITEFHISGSGVKIPNGWFAGPMISVSGAAATSGGFEYRDGMQYKTNIPVSPGGTFNIEGFIIGEDIGTAHLLAEVEYDGVPGKITDADVRDDAIGAAANTPVALTSRGAAVVEGDFRPTGTIIEVIFGAALDPTGDAANGLNWCPALQLTGPGLMNAGNYSFLGPAGPTQPDTDVSGNQQCINNPSRKICNIATKAGNSTIRPMAQNIESINPGQAVCCLCYGS